MREQGGDFSWVLLPGGDRSRVMSGGNAAVAAAERAQRAGEPLLWVRLGGHAYVVRDEGFTSRAQSLLRPVTDIASQQLRLGQEQAALGGRLGEVGGRQGAAAAQEALAKAFGGARPGSPGVADLQAQMHELQARMDAMTRDQQAHGARMEQARGDAERQLRALADEAISAGVAEPVD